MKILFVALALILNLSASYKANEIKINGLTQISDKIAVEVLGISKGDTYTSNDINDALKRFYEFNYFSDIKVYNKKNILQLDFIEKPFIINIEMKGYKTKGDDLEFLLELMNIKKGNMYSPQRVTNAKKILSDQLKDEGFIHSVIEVNVEKINEQSVSIIFNVNKGDEIIIKKVSYIGAKNLTDTDFEEHTANKQEDLVSWWFGQNDGKIQFSQMQYDSRRIKDVYLRNGYLDARVTPAYSNIDFNTNVADVDFNIKEGNQYKVNKIIIFHNNKIIKTKDITDYFLQKEKKTFNISMIRKDLETIKTKIANKGYGFVKINYDIRKNRANKTTDVIYNVVENNKVYINDVIIKNNTRTLDRVIRRYIYLAPKDLYNFSELKQSKHNLKRTGFFKSVKITEKLVSHNQINLIVDVQEAPTGNIVVGGGYGSYNGWMINASIKDKNIFGSGLDLGFSVEHTNKSDSATISLANPSINDSIYSGNFKLYKKRSLITNNNNSSIGDETINSKGLELGVGRSINRFTRIGILYGLDQEDIKFSNDVKAFENYLTSSATTYINFNNTDDYNLPRSGIKVGTSFKYAGIGGDAKYLQNTTYFKYFLGLNKYINYDAIFRFKTKVGSIQDLGNIFNKTYYMGGPTSLRGYKSYAFQPKDKIENPYKKTITSTIELSLPLIKKANMRLALFYDKASIGEESLNEIKKSSYGVSINWFSPVGPVQFIFSRANKPSEEDKLKTSNFEFSLGNTF